MTPRDDGPPVLVVVIIGVILVLATPSQAEEAAPSMLPPAVVTALAELEAFPEDYGAARRLAEVATTWGAWTMALRGWTRAEELSGASYETAMGKVVPLLELGRYAEARNAAREATVLAPESGDAWRLLAWSRRQKKAWQTGTYARLGAASAYRTALRVDPGDSSAAWPGRSWAGVTAWAPRRGSTRSWRRTRRMPARCRASNPPHRAGELAAASGCRDTPTPRAPTPRGSAA